MPLQDAPTLFAEGVVAAFLGQIALLHVVRATLEVLAKDSAEAKLVLKSLETQRLARTVFNEIALRRRVTRLTNRARSTGPSGLCASGR